MEKYLKKYNVRYFEKFPCELKCPVCGTGDEDYGVLIGIDGTAEGNNEQAAPVHLHCLLDVQNLRINKEVGFMYRRIDKEEKSNGSSNK